MTLSKLKLSGSTDGQQIKVVATATAGTLLHTAVTGTSSLDEIWLWAVNNHSADVTLTIEYGGVAADDQIKVVVPFQAGFKQILPGVLLQNAKVVRAFASVASVVNIQGFVNRIA